MEIYDLFRIYTFLLYHHILNKFRAIYYILNRFDEINDENNKKNIIQVMKNFVKHRLNDSSGIVK